jgi:site-specific DNA recombinase
MFSPYDFIVSHPPLVRRLVEKVTIYEDKFIVEFKSSVTVDVNE